VPLIAHVEPLTSTRALSGPFDYRLESPLADGEVEVGSMLVVPFGRREILGVVVGVSESSEVAEERLLAPLRALELGVAEEMVGLARWVAQEYCSTFARALALVLPPEAQRRLSGRRRGRVARPGPAPAGSGANVPPRLTKEQKDALEAIEAALRVCPGEGRLVHGVTGSGKTELYMRAAAIALHRGRGVIVLVPEIALTSQITARFCERFGDTVAVLHSQLRPAERYAEWRRLRSGEARVCVGPRSAVFAPVGELGLLVVDEEHDSSYKHEGDPRYDARDVAAERARRAGALLLLGSATPRAESAHRLPQVRLRGRIDGRPLPHVDVLDMREQQHGLHPHTASALAAVRAAREKAIVLLNRRGWSNFLSCRSCGRVWSCPSCDVALVLHRESASVACHHCGHREPAPQRCPECLSTSVARHGAGTERLAAELERALDDGSFPIFRLDADAIAAERGGGGAESVLERFGAARCGVLLGTQMVAKGHDFQDVTLGVVLDADATLRFPDFRAEERTFALIAQLAGRVGRGGAGSVLVQTIAPDARSIVHAARHDSDDFLAGELERRRALSYPPFSHLIRVTCSAASAAGARAAAQDVRRRLPDGGGRGEMTLLGPAPLFRLRGRERETLLAKTSERCAAVRAIGDAVAAVAAGGGHAGVSFSVDVEPH
jgi:primosomal protein N' (replication factor Y) (superfamily II helicase)